MGIKALNLQAVDPYVSDLDEGKNAIFVNQAEVDAWDKSKSKDKGERPKEVYEHSPDATKFLIGTLDSIVMGILADDVTSIGEGGMLNIRQADNDTLAFRLGVKGWESFVDDKGQPVVFRTEKMLLRGKQVDAIPDELVGMVPIPVVREVGREVKSRNSLSAVQAKN